MGVTNHLLTGMILQVCNFPMAQRGQEKNSQSNQSPYEPGNDRWNPLLKSPSNHWVDKFQFSQNIVKRNDRLGLYMKEAWKMIMNLSRTDYLYLHVLMHDLMEMSTETKHYYIYYTNFTVHVLHLALDCADVVFSLLMSTMCFPAFWGGVCLPISQWEFLARTPTRPVECEHG